MKNGNFLGLSERHLGWLNVSLIFFVSATSIKILFSSDTSLSVGENQLIISNSAGRLDELARQLEVQAVAIERKEQAYQELQTIYNRSLKQEQGYERLKGAIETIEELPDIGSVDEIRDEISQTKSNLVEITK